MKEKFRALTRRTALIATIAGGALLGVATPQAYAHYCGVPGMSQCNGCLAGRACMYGGRCESCCESSCNLGNCGNNSLCVLHCSEECATACGGQSCNPY